MIDEIIQSGIISAKDALSLSDKAVFLDCTFVLPNSDEDVSENFQMRRIPGALLFDIGAISDPRSPLPSMLPDQEHFAQSMQTLGINNDDLIILYGQHGSIMGPARVWWMLKGFGHERTVVLDGGLPAWIKSGFDVHSGPQSAPLPSFYSSHSFNSQCVIDINEMLALSEAGACPILDARPQNRFNGSTAEPRTGMRSGHIPNSMNIPCSKLVKEDGCFKSRSDLLDLFSNVDLSGRIALTCGSGITACALALALYHIGHKDFSVYDGSWSEWGREESGTKVAR